MTKLDEALEIAERLVKFSLFRSMNQLRQRLKYELKSRGLEDQIRNFKLKRAGNHEVSVHVRPGMEKEVTRELSRFP